MQTELSHTSITTNQSLPRDLQRSAQAIAIAEAILESGLADSAKAKWLSEMVVHLCDPTMVDAATFRGAEALFLIRTGRDAALRSVEQRQRQHYITEAHRVIWAYSNTLYGLLSPHQVAASYADFANHKAETVQRTAAARKVLAFGGLNEPA